MAWGSFLVGMLAGGLGFGLAGVLFGCLVGERKGVTADTQNGWIKEVLCGMANRETIIIEFTRGIMPDDDDDDGSFSLPPEPQLWERN